MLSTLIDTASGTIPIHIIKPAGFGAWKQQASPLHRAWCDTAGYTGKSGKALILPNEEGKAEAVIFSTETPQSRWTLSGLAAQLPAGAYRLPEDLEADMATRAALSWALESYRFTTYKKAERIDKFLLWPAQADRAYVTAALEAIILGRDLINSPANDMGPVALTAAAQSLADKFGAMTKTIEGEALKTKNFPAIYTVGQAAADSPRLVDIEWGDPAHKKITLVGKGVTFDTGGLDIKPPSNMLLMKKDMGGAAHALALGAMVMALKLPIRLRILLPIVENSIAGNAMRPSDVIPTRKGLTVEIGNTDAEGRVILADALALASEDQPALIIDFATLTGAARVALGPELPAMFVNDEATASALIDAAETQDDPLWRLPLWPGYAGDIESKIADITNSPSSSFAGAIHAALFLERFVDKTIPWAHFDVYGWNAKSRPGRPEGGEIFVLHACFHYLKTLCV